LYSCVNYLNNPQTSISTVEDPVEVVIDGIAQCSVNSGGRLSIEESMQQLARQDPDVVVLGNMHDRLGAEAAVQAALRGRKVLTTFHAEDALGALMRLVHTNLNAYLVSSTLSCIVAQRLVRRICAACAQPYAPTAEDHRRLGYVSGSLDALPFKLGGGCVECRSTGYRGRVSVFELLVLNDDLNDALMSHKSPQEIRRIALESALAGTLLEDGLLKASRGVTSLAEVITNLPKFYKPRSIQELRQLGGEED
jgi:type IV pilus assembly protein PilB